MSVCLGHMHGSLRVTLWSWFSFSFFCGFWALNSGYQALYCKHSPGRAVAPAPVCDLTLPNLHPNHRSEGKAQHISFVEYNFCGWVMLSPLCSEKILTRNSKRKALEVFLSKRARCVESPSYLADQVLHVFSVLQGCGLVSSMVMGPLFSGQLNIEILGNKRAGRSQRHNFTCPLNFESLFLSVCV